MSSMGQKTHLYGGLRRPRRPAGLARILALAAVFACFMAGPAAGQHAGTHSAEAHSTVVQTASAPSSGSTILGEVLPMGDGTVRSWVATDPEGRPTAVGITLTEAALSGLTADATPGLIWTTEYLIDLPGEDLQLPFDHVGLNWNPRGHMPQGIYNVPHFDMHFYTISTDVRRSITARGDDLERCRRPAAASYMPEGYVFAPDSEEPGMGGHWVDPASHEFHDAAFTSTFVYGTHDGAIIFYEPMITKAYLETKPNVVIPIVTPQQYARPGYYPTRYSIRFDEQRKEYTVALEGLTLRQAS